MIEYKQGNIFDSDAEALVNTVNCVGIMGAGLALQFKNKFADYFNVYKIRCDHGEIKVGEVDVYSTENLIGVKYIVSFPTKNNFTYGSKVEYIRDGMASLVLKIKRLGIKSIAIPPLGCGLGGLKWEQTKPIILKALEEIPDVRVIIYEPRCSAN